MKSSIAVRCLNAQILLKLTRPVNRVKLLMCLIRKNEYKLLFCKKKLSIG